MFEHFGIYLCLLIIPICAVINKLGYPLSVSAAAEGVDDVKVKAVNEMMERIKHGVVLRPVKSQDSKVRTAV